ncbi:peptidase inhibitor family I36 protein [Amycolatopsis acididurans]|nr:peptidase inhibitor family I36 protein [Amycolatopsis acididurans]
MRLRAYLPKALVLAAIGLLGASGVAQAEQVSPPDRPEFSCQQGEFCAWPGEFYSDYIQRLDLRTANPEECIVLPNGIEARSLANRMTRDVTVYQDNECSTEGDFTTYPGNGTFVPHAPFVVRAVQIWDGA